MDKVRKKVSNERKAVIKEVEELCEGSAEYVLPGIFFKNMEDLDIKQIITLNNYIDMYCLGKGIIRE